VIVGRVFKGKAQNRSVCDVTEERGHPSGRRWVWWLDNAFEAGWIYKMFICLFVYLTNMSVNSAGGEMESGEMESQRVVGVCSASLAHHTILPPT